MVDRKNKKSIFCPMITKEDIGGGIKSTITLMNGLQMEGHEVTVLIPKTCTYLHKFNTEITVLFFEKDPVISISNPINYYKLCKLVKKKFQKLNTGTIYFCSDRPALMLALLLGKSTSIYYISRGWFYTNWSARFLRLFLFSRVSQFIGISNKQFDLMKLYAKPHSKVALIENGIQLPAKQFTPFQNNTIVLTTIGGICERKNQLQCIGLIHLLKDKYRIKLVLFGTTFTPVDEMYKQKLEKYIEHHQLENYVEFKGHETNFDLIYGQSDIIISSATEEGFGRTLIEAMSYGIPVIASDMAGGPSMIINHEKDGLLFDSSLDDLQKKTETLINNVPLRNYIIKNALSKVESKYTEKIMCKNYSNLIENGN